MPNRLPVPDELLPLIEKREGADRRSGNDHDQSLPATDSPQSIPDSVNDKTTSPNTERRSGTDRRGQSDQNA